MRHALLSLCLLLVACVTSRVEDVRFTPTGLLSDEAVVILARSYHLGNKTEAKFTKCVIKAVEDDIRVIPTDEFIDSIFPWFEPRTAPFDTKGLPELFERPGVAEAIAAKEVRYIIWLNGDTERVDSGGSMACSIGPSGGGCFGFAWWEDDSKYNALIWDLTAVQESGQVFAKVSGTSFMPGLVIPIPLLARTRHRACEGMAKQLTAFIADSE